MATAPIYLYIQYRALPYSSSSAQIFVIKVILGTENYSLVCLYLVHISASWTQCKNIPVFIAILPQYYFKNDCAKLMSQGRKKSLEIWEVDLFHKLGLAFLRSLHWPQHWQGCWGMAAPFCAGQPSASSVLHELVWQSRIHVWGSISFCLFLGFPLAMSNDLFFPALAEI